jgi:hypothetical protein
LSYLLEIIFKTEEGEGKKKEAAPSNEYEVIIRRRLQRWQKKPWVLPDFLKGQ